jgi:hypothetical protein
MHVQCCHGPVGEQCSFFQFYRHVVSSHYPNLRMAPTPQRLFLHSFLALFYPNAISLGSAIYIRSLLSDQSPLYNVTLDGHSTNVNGSIPTQSFDCRTLYSKTDLDPKVEHTVRLSISNLSPSQMNATSLFSLIDYTLSRLSLVFVVFVVVAYEPVSYNRYTVEDPNAASKCVSLLSKSHRHEHGFDSPLDTGSQINTSLSA